MAKTDADENISALVQEANRDGFCVLKDFIPKEKILQWREACLPLLQRQMELEGPATSRGSARYYVTIPFIAPFNDTSIYASPVLLAIVEKLAGKDFVMCQLASDTPVHGSDYQGIHRDCPPLFPEWGKETPMFQLAVNFPLVDVTKENGPLEIIRGTHMMSRDEGMAKYNAGELKLETIEMKMGDVLIRDVRTLHRGTPNHTKTPRPMVVIGYSRSWLYRPEVNIQILREEHEKLTDKARHMLRHNPIVDKLDFTPRAESYTNFLY